MKLKKQLSYGGNLVEYFLEVKDQKSIRLRIDNQRIIVSAPVYTQDWQIEQLLYKNIKKILLMQENQKSRYPFIVDGNILKVKIFGEYVDFEIITSNITKSLKNKNVVKMYDNQDEFISHTYKRLAILYYDLFNEKLIEHSKRSELNIKNLSIKYMKSRWGVCYPELDKIILNITLLHYPIECLEYVIVHELSHTQHKNHSKDFWYLVEKNYPNYKEASKLLK
ncbi:M48 family metallopeptidase [Spiroplasma endosymbiont of Othius punctulatus]|uniref:M48 family metallopeptidase n=1 Tax=Spiroplasma endosymbiont of Othius punctulatus TaxID=3066289 RepID=UPI0030CD547B